MMRVYNNFIDAQERRRIERLELFDEFEEWYMMQASQEHYCVAYAINDAMGQFEILSLSGSFMPTDNQGTRSRSGGMSVSLSSPDGRVVGGGVAVLLVAAGPVQVVVGSFLPNNRQEQKPKKPKSDYAPANVTPSIAVSSAPPPTNGEKEDVMGGHLLHNIQEQPLTQTLFLPRPFVAKTGLTCTPFQT